MVVEMDYDTIPKFMNKLVHQGGFVLVHLEDWLKQSGLSQANAQVIISLAPKGGRLHLIPDLWGILPEQGFVYGAPWDGAPKGNLSQPIFFWLSLLCSAVLGHLGDEKAETEKKQLWSSPNPLLAMVEFLQKNLPQL
jgi:hypothetical protein